MLNAFEALARKIPRMASPKRSIQHPLAERESARNFRTARAFSCLAIRPSRPFRVRSIEGSFENTLVPLGKSPEDVAKILHGRRRKQNGQSVFQRALSRLGSNGGVAERHFESGKAVSPFRAYISIFSVRRIFYGILFHPRSQRFVLGRLFAKASLPAENRRQSGNGKRKESRRMRKGVEEWHGGRESEVRV